MAAFRMATTCQSAPASVRFCSAKSWAHHADGTDHESALDAYQTANELLPCLATIGLDLQLCQQDLRSASDSLAHDGAACAI